jgi:tRNA pseudouridine55 synthase
LPLAIREATKLVNYIQDDNKSYVGTIHLGVETDTLDAQGEVTRLCNDAIPEKEAFSEVMERFRGEIEQIPPMYSAVKKNGVPLHRLARRGEEVERDPKKVTIQRLDLIRFESGRAEVVVDCSAGTYVRVLAADIGEQLGCGAHLESLRRLRSGPFDVSQALTMEQLEQDAEAGCIEERLVAPADATGFQRIDLSADGTRRVLHGADVSPGAKLRAAPGELVLSFTDEGILLALMELRADRRLWPLRVLAPDRS